MPDGACELEVWFVPKPAPNLSWGEVAAGGDGDGDRWRSFSAVAPPLGEVDPGKGSVGVAGGVCDGACELKAWIVSTSFSLGILSLL